MGQPVLVAVKVKMSMTKVGGHSTCCERTAKTLKPKQDIETTCRITMEKQKEKEDRLLSIDHERKKMGEERDETLWAEWASITDLLNSLESDC